PPGLPFVCRGTLRLRHGVHSASTTARFTIPAGSTATVRPRLARGERRSLARRHRLALNLSAAITNAGATYRFAGRVTIRR
ncbi:MAG: hypothetical protein JWN32_1244, partial [Solirubrobacterales bacterium]|nr:hypothetical protein [Solirubrobacterales bacterium]